MSNARVSAIGLKYPCNHLRYKFGYAYEIGLLNPVLAYSFVLDQVGRKYEVILIQETIVSLLISLQDNNNNNNNNNNNGHVISYFT